jgi:hypothetical protein
VFCLEIELGVHLQCQTSPASFALRWGAECGSEHLASGHQFEEGQSGSSIAHADDLLEDRLVLSRCYQEQKSLQDLYQANRGEDY